jgi:Uma2 family endonuclease
MSTTAQALLTADEFMRLYGGETFVDLVDGKVERQPMPHRLHGYICHNVAFALGAFVRDRDLGRIMTNDTFVRIRRDPDTLRGADVMYMSYERLPKGPIPEDGLDPAPDLVAEVRSPSNTWASLVAKGLDYLNAGVTVVLLIDPDTATVSVYRLNEIQQVYDNGDELTLPDVLPGFAVPVKRFFE